MIGLAARMLVAVAAWAAPVPDGAFVGPIPGPPSAGVHRYGIVIGSDEGKPSEPPLAYAEQDAERIADVLASLGGFRAEDLVILRDEPADRVRQVFADVARRMAWNRDNDRASAGDGAEHLLFVYYSGHGDAGALHLGRTELPLAELKALAQGVPADVRVLVVDACRSGELTRLKGAVQAEPFAIRAEDRLDSEGMVIITSSSAGEDAQESERLQGGVFTHHLVAGLLGAADTTGDARITLQEAYRYGYARTLEATSQAPEVQHPTYAFELSGRDDLVLTRLDSPERGGRLVLRDPGTWLLFAANRGGALQTEATVAAGGTLTLPPGTYVARLREADGVREARLTIARGEVAALARSDMQAVPYGATVRRGLTERRRSIAATVGGGITGPWVPDTVPAPVGAMGARLDSPALSFGLRAHVAASTSDNGAVALIQRRVGLDVEAVRRVDLGPVSPGFGVRLGGDLVAQAFRTDGEAAPHQDVVGRVGPWLGADLALSARLAIGVAGGADVELYRTLDSAGAGPLAAMPVPYALTEVIVYAR